MAQSFDEFIAIYGRTGFDVPVAELSASNPQETIIVEFGDKKAVINAIAVAAGTPNEHLCIDVYPFSAGNAARAGVFGMENGRRYHGFEHGTPGTSHGLPATRSVSVLIGAQ